MVKCLVTGGLGFIGSHVIDLLVEQGFEVVSLDNEKTGSRDNCNQKAAYHQADITNLTEIRPYFTGIDYVFHLAALPRIKPSFDDPVTFLNVNVIGTVNCLLAAKEANVKKFIFSSSSSVYGNDFTIPTKEDNSIHPLNPYAVQKYESEMYCRLFSETYGMNVVILRYFNVYGPRSFNEKDPFSAYSSPVEIFLRLRKAGQPLTITWDGEQKRDYVYVKDVARANYLAAITELPQQFTAFNIGSGENHTVNEIAEIIGGESVRIPKREGEARVTLADNSKANELLRWTPQHEFRASILKMKEEEGLLSENGKG